MNKIIEQYKQFSRELSKFIKTAELNILFRAGCSIYEIYEKSINRKYRDCSLKKNKKIGSLSNRVETLQVTELNGNEVGQNSHIIHGVD